MEYDILNKIILFHYMLINTKYKIKLLFNIN